jgi:hypothetical protein
MAAPSHRDGLIEHQLKLWSVPRRRFLPNNPSASFNQTSLTDIGSDITNLDFGSVAPELVFFTDSDYNESLFHLN